MAHVYVLGRQLQFALRQHDTAHVCVWGGYFTTLSGLLGVERLGGTRTERDLDGTGHVLIEILS